MKKNIILSSAAGLLVSVCLIAGEPTCTLNVKLKPGNNEIRIGNDHAAAPDIDCILLVKN